MPRPAAKRARVARNDPPAAAQPAKTNATRGRPRKVSTGQSKGSVAKAKPTSTFKFDTSNDAGHSETEGQSDGVQDQSSGMTRKDREREMAGSQTPVRDRQQVNAPLSSGVGMGASLRLQAFPGSARREMNHRGHTPAFESSILSTFRPRPRQPSILQLVGDDSLDLGSSELGSEDLLGSFDPEDVSTPLPASRRKSLKQADITPTANKKTPKLPQVFVEIPLRHDIIADNRIPDEPSLLDEAPDEPPVVVEVPEDPVIIDEPAEEPAVIDQQTDERHVLPETQQVNPVVDEDDDDCSSLTSIDSLPVMNFTLEQVQAPRRQTMTMAPPESSIGSITPPASTPQSSAKQQSHCPPSRFPHLSTTSLQEALLPRRRQRRKGLANRRSKRPKAGAKDYVLSAPGSEDELNYTGGQQASEEDTPSQQKSAKRSQGQAKFKMREKAQNTTQPKKGRGKAAATTSHPTKRTTPKKTYSRLSKTDGDADWDKENLSDELEVSSDRDIVAPIVSEELLLQKKKFAEIDEWSIDFEEVLDDEVELY
ncbi:hypothetical protein MauCBS54593_001315 [Microsporum audouinii]